MFETTLGLEVGAGDPRGAEPLAIRNPSRARALFARIAPGATIEDAASTPAPDAARGAEERAGHVPERPLFARIAPPRAGTEPAPAAAADVAPSGAPAPGFEALLRRDTRRHAAQRVAFTGVGAAVQGSLVACSLGLAAALAEPPPKELPMVEVRLASAFPRRPGSPHAPGAPAAPRSVARRTAPVARPAVRPPPPTALLQPREVTAEMRAPAPGEPVEDVGFGDGPVGAEPGPDDGVIGGVPGGEGGGEWGGGAAVAAAHGERGDEVEEAPQWATAGFRRPVERQPGCVARSVRLPHDLAGFTSGPYVVRFAVLASGAVGRIELLGEIPDPRLRRAIEQAVTGCGWQPGADAQGRPVALWVVLPIRFESA